MDTLPASIDRTLTPESGCGTILEPCPQYLMVKERFSNTDSVNILCDSIYDIHLFKRTSDDKDIGALVEDRMFMDIMDKVQMESG